jgi:hypothetical protein
MAYLGNTPTTQNFVSGTDYFNGTGSQTAFTLSRTVGSINDIQVTVNNVVQQPNDAYTLSGTTLTMTSAPSSGTNNVYVRYLSTTTQVITPSQNTVGTAQLGTITNIASGNSSLTLQTGSSPTTAVTIDTSQNVGIGTSSPATKLNIGFTGADAVNTFRIEGSNGSSERYAFDIQADGANTATKFLIGSGGGAPTERMRITSAGDLLIGETGGTSKLSITQSSNSSTAIRIVYSGTGAFPIEAITQNASYTGAGIRSRVQNLAAGTGYYAFSYYNDNAADYRFLVLGNGNVQNTNNSYGALSDVKLKENIVDATPKLEDLCKVKVRQYNLKSDPTHKQIGVVAQELEEVFAGLVEETQDRDVDGKYLGTTTKQVKYSVFVPMLIKALQELNAKVDAQAVRIAELEGVA